MILSKRKIQGIEEARVCLDRNAGSRLSQNSGTASQNQPPDVLQCPRSRKHLHGIWPFTTFAIFAAGLLVNLRGGKPPYKASDLKTRYPAADLGGQAVQRSKKSAAPKSMPPCRRRSIHWSNYTDEALNTDAYQLVRCDLTGSFGFTTLRHSYTVVGFERNQHASHENECHWKEIVDTPERKMYRQTTAQKATGEFYAFHVLGPMQTAECMTIPAAATTIP
ncbi:uncharacterized protein K441DRAFT_251438 [Cenococcum geophilum 1.58]|uniref:uncharacterized protein n=1 Tax=Cenococcum geophilum 1.58 TaxID=794803 RepID=UPI00358ECB90|nr:hypothetical protein K441DRAFT_251438 [Cenococcum geophilum 1.58]